MTPTVRPAHAAAARYDDRSVIVWHSLAPRRAHLVEFDHHAMASRFLAAVAAGKPPRTNIPDIDDVLHLPPGVAAPDTENADAITAVPHALCLLVAQGCNFGCAYCVAEAPASDGRPAAPASGGRPAAAARMDWPTAQASLDWFAALVVGSATPVRIGFTGGEPLLAWPVVRDALALIRDDPRLATARLSMNTNASLVTRSTAETLADHGVTIATSLDGSPEASDLVRVLRRNGRGASARILAGWQILRDAGCAFDGFLATFNDRNVHGLDSSLLDFAEQWGFHSVRVEYDVVNPIGVDPRRAAERIWSVYREGRRRGILVDGFWAKPARHLLRAGTRPLRFCGAAAGDGITVHPDGRISSCPYSRTNLGQVTAHAVDLDRSALRRLVASRTPGRRTECRGCDLEGACAGGCSITLEHADTAVGRAALDFNCALYRELTPRLLAEAASMGASVAPEG